MKVLLADDEKSIAITLGDALKAAGHQVLTVGDGESALRAVRSDAFDCVITDQRMPKADGMAILKAVKEARPQTAVIVITAYGSGELGFQAAKVGAYDFIQKPFFNEDVVLKLDRLEKFLGLQAENDRLRQELAARGGFGPLVGRSEAMRGLFEQIRSVAASDCGVLIEGESGTGKELVARQIHLRSPRMRAPFEVVSSGFDTLVEDDLFGHVKGAFTDARSDRPGKFERAHTGTIFIDDIDDMPAPTQVKLLRVIEEKQVERLGDTKPIRVDVRVVAATKLAPYDLVKKRKFREDLFYRLNVATLRLPPLRERTGDIEVLVQHFIDRYGKGRAYTVRPDVLESMKAYPWPGNVRELEHSIERAIAFAGEDRVLKREHLLKPLQAQGAEEATPPGALPALRAVVEKAETEHIRKVLAFTGNHKGEAARILGITRKNLWEKIRLYGIGGSGEAP